MILQSMIRNNLLILVTCLAIFASADDQGDWVDTYDLPIEFIAKPFYAGYLNITHDKAYYYVYYPSEKNPSKDPLIVRISSGPGCSSLYSFLYSKGPFIFSPNTTNLRVNPHNWNKEANILFIEGPAGVGFAHGDSQNMTDSRFAEENILALLKFYEKFPERKNQDVYLTGAEYAGVTIPYMALYISELNNNPDTPTWEKIQLKGFLLENPCTLGDECDSHFQFSQYQMAYLLRHYFISIEKYQEYMQKCQGLMRDQCQAFRVQIENAFQKTGSDIRNLYKQCYKQVVPEYYKCMDIMGILAFFDNLHVKQDMHANTDINWQFCNFTLMEKFQRNPQGSFKIYEKLLKEQHNLRIWIVSGALSAATPIVGTRKWIEDLRHQLDLVTTRPWESWKFDQDINAGEIQQMKGISLITVRSAGLHLYNDQPEIGYHIIDSFVKGMSL